MTHVYGVLAMPVGNLASKLAIRAAGCTHTVIAAQWDKLQPGGPGSALAPAAVSSLIQEFADAASADLKVMLEVQLQYPPSWVLSGVEKFKDQFGNTFDGAAQPVGGGRQQVNWMWTALGWQYVADLCAKLGIALGGRLIAQTESIKIGGGYFGELHYPDSDTFVVAPAYSFWAYGASMQTGIGLASGQVICPNPGYIIYSGTDAQDSALLNWYLNGLGTWLMFFVGTMRAAGWSCDFYVCQSGYGVRSNQTHLDGGYRQSAANGEDTVRMMGVYAHDSKIWPYCTWMNTADGFSPASVDSDISAWKKVYEEAVKRNKHFKLRGENTGGENAAGLRGIFSGNPNGSAMSTVSYPLAPPQGVFGYQGIFWLSYPSLTSGLAADAQLADYATAIAALH